jgi:DNA-directed RNA polymerase subunit RPC12/RpoP
MTNLESILKTLEEANAKRTQTKWEYIGSVGVDYECSECGNEFPEPVYVVKSSDEYQRLECHLYGMELFAKPDAEFIALAANHMAKLLEIVRVQSLALESILTNRMINPRPEFLDWVDFHEQDAKQAQEEVERIAGSEATIEKKEEK